MGLQGNHLWITFLEPQYEQHHEWEKVNSFNLEIYIKASQSPPKQKTWRGDILLLVVENSHTFQ